MTSSETSDEIRKIIGIADAIGDGRPFLFDLSANLIYAF